MLLKPRPVYKLHVNSKLILRLYCICYKIDELIAKPHIDPPSLEVVIEVRFRCVTIVELILVALNSL